MNNLPRVVARIMPRSESNPRPLDHESNALPLHHRVTWVGSVIWWVGFGSMTWTHGQHYTEQQPVFYLLVMAASNMIIPVPGGRWSTNRIRCQCETHRHTVGLQCEPGEMTEAERSGKKPRVMASLKNTADTLQCKQAELLAVTDTSVRNKLLNQVT